jgi:hypothetical protein
MINKQALVKRAPASKTPSAYSTQRRTKPRRYSVLLVTLREQKNREAKQLLSQLAGTICVNQYTEGQAATKKKCDEKSADLRKSAGNKNFDIQYSTFICSSVQL